MKDLTVGKEGKLIFYFAMPMLLGNVFQQLYNIVDSAVVGNYIGKEALAAVGASFPIIFTLISLIIGVASGAMIVISQYYGAKDIERVKRTIDTFYIFVFLASILISIIGVIYSERIFRLMQLPEDIIPQAKTYFNIYVLGMISFFGFNGTSAVLRGLGDSKTPLYFLILATLINIILDLLFVIVFKWGIAGVAYATLVSQTGAFVTAILYLNKTHEIVKLRILKLKFDFDLFKKSLRIGIPNGLSQTFVALGAMAMMTIVNTFGTNVIAGYSIAIRLDALAVMPAMNFSAALATFVGQNMGANKQDRVRMGVLSTLAMSGIFSLMVTFSIQLWGEQLLHLFTKDSEVIRYGFEYLGIVSWFYILFSIMFTYSGVLRGAGDTLIPMFITLTALWIVRIPSAYFLSKRFGELGIWWAVPMGMITGVILTFIYYKTGRYKTKGVVKYDK
jgi:putative MATE family efflux protein